ncbi:aminoacetone oxidase family FAD-binding enzyme, partial [Candidatus Gracilibacteria bacterium]|nr:aminoacetone oxidase family FAD-binding enzyme [Candidatus Gracilibacteria bacterium]
MVYDLIVIGGGAAGMMGAAIAIEGSIQSGRKLNVAIIERNNKLGRKVAISGGGRCNVTTGIEDPKEILKRYPRGAKFLSYGMYEFGPAKVREWFNEHGLPTKVEEDLRVFPVSDHGEDVIEVYKKIFAQNNVEIMYGEIVKSVQKNNEEFVVELNTGKKISSKNIVLASGGQAYRHTGSQGDSYSFAQALGHSITQLGPSLNSFLLRQPWVKSLAGVSFEKATLSSPLNKKYIFSGAFVFTHRGISGPAVFAMSSLTAFEKYSPQAPMPLTIDFFPDSNNEQLLKKITELITAHPRKNFANIIDMLLPKSMVEVVITQSHADGQRDSAQVSKQTL